MYFILEVILYISEIWDLIAFQSFTFIYHNKITTLLMYRGKFIFFSWFLSYS